MSDFWVSNLETWVSLTGSEYAREGGANEVQFSRDEFERLRQ